MQQFLFTDPKTGGPYTGERFNRLWRKAAEATRADPTSVSWPAGVPYRNMRHRAAMWFKDVAGALDRDWELVSLWLGNSASTCRNHYVLPSGEALASAAIKLRSARGTNARQRIA